MTGGQRRWKNTRSSLSTVYAFTADSTNLQLGVGVWGVHGADVEHGVELLSMICTICLHIVFGDPVWCSEIQFGPAVQLQAPPTSGQPGHLQGSLTLAHREKCPNY